MTEPTHDVIVIGGGPVGENAAQYAIQDASGTTVRTAALVEAELVGGECSYWACMPSKALLLPGALRDRAAAMQGVQVSPELDVDAVLARRDSFTSDWDDAGQVEWAEGAGMEVVRGRGRLSAERSVIVTDAEGRERTLVARHAVVLATGSTPQLPPIPGLAEALPWGSRDATSMHEVPGSVLVLGGGVIACEAATWLAALGSTVTMVVRGDALLGRLEPVAGERVLASLRDAGVDVRLGAGLDRVERADARDTGTGHVHGGPVTATVDGEAIVVSELVVATGRTPASADLGLAAVGIDELDVDDRLRVAGGGDWLYACGDVAGRSQLTHMGKHEARTAGRVIAALATGGSADDVPADAAPVTQVVFTEPEVASVGMTRADAEGAGVDVVVVDMDIAVAGSSLARSDVTGRIVVIVDRAREAMVGATLVGDGVGELLHAATIAIVAEVPMERLWQAVPAYPTVSEVWLRVSEAYRQQRG